MAATQFTFYMVCSNIGIALGAAALGPLRARLDWSGMFLCSAGVLLLALVLTILGTAFVRQTPRRVGADRLGSDEGSARCPTQAAIEEPAHRSGHTGP